MMIRTLATLAIAVLASALAAAEDGARIRIDAGGSVRIENPQRPEVIVEPALLDDRHRGLSFQVDAVDTAEDGRRAVLDGTFLQRGTESDGTETPVLTVRLSIEVGEDAVHAHLRRDEVIADTAGQLVLRTRIAAARHLLKRTDPVLTLHGADGSEARFRFSSDLGHLGERAAEFAPIASWSLATADRVWMRSELDTSPLIGRDAFHISVDQVLADDDMDGLSLDLALPLDDLLAGTDVDLSWSPIPEALRTALAHPESVTELKLENVDNLEVLPEELGDLVNLEQLRISSRSLETLPESIGRLTALRVIGINGNNRSHASSTGIIRFPESLGDCAALEEITIYGARLEGLPESIGRLTKLRRVFLGHNNVTTFPESIGDCQALELLKCPDNPFVALPDRFCDLQALRYLDLGGARPDRRPLAELPERFGELSSLEFFSNTSPLVALPESFGDLPSLLAFGMGEGRFPRLPAMHAAEQLRWLAIVGNPELVQVDLDVTDNPCLSWLRIRHAPQLAQLPQGLSHATNLRFLDYDETALAELPAELAELPELVQLRVPTELDDRVAELLPDWQRAESDRYPSWDRGGHWWLAPGLVDPLVVEETIQRNVLRRVRDAYPGYDRFLPAIDLAGQGLTGELRLRLAHRPATLGLEGLDLSDNALSGLERESFAAFVHLAELDLAGNPLAGAPAVLQDLEALRVLDLRDTGLDEAALATIRGWLPEAEIRTGTREEGAAPEHHESSSAQGLMLRELSCSGTVDRERVALAYNELDTFPTWACAIDDLRVLELAVNQLRELPPEIGDLTALETLDLGSNLLTTLPPEIGALAALRELDCSLNELTALPDAITRLSTLRELDLCGNHLTALPADLDGLKQLERLDLRANPIPDDELARIRTALPDCEVLQ